MLYLFIGEKQMYQRRATLMNFFFEEIQNFQYELLEREREGGCK